ncbi:sugar transferase [Cohnella yongneupensis]|uniref:Sugar transferase n=1 Tax=Cohnella yongneupensis TaxID=425006 RepID=A0ABW0R5H6_9BACL
MNKPGLTFRQRSIKRSLDLVVSVTLLALTFWLILLAFAIASLETKSNGFFTQARVGRNGKLFKIIKIRTMHPKAAFSMRVTASNDPRITRFGRLFRKSKIDELPQLINVLLGHMSLVGPRPDTPGMVDRLEGRARDILLLRPGITGPSTIKYRKEELILAEVDDPVSYHREVLFPDKCRINLLYLEQYSLIKDLKYMLWTVFPLLQKEEAIIAAASSLHDINSYFL